MEGKAAQPSRLDAMQQSLRLQPLRFLFLVIIFLQLYLSNSVSLPSIIGILLSCAVYAFYVDSKAKRSPAIQPLPSPALPSEALPSLPAPAPATYQTCRHVQGASDDAPPAPLPSESSDLNDANLQQQQQQQPRTPTLSGSAAAWEPSFTRSSASGTRTKPSFSSSSAAPPSQPPTSTIFVGNMSSVVNEADLLQMFGPFGDIIVARIQRGTKQKGLKMCVHCCAAASSPCLSSHAHNHRRFIGFVDFYSVDSAVAAVRALQGVSLCGRPMRLEFSQVHAQPACNHKHPALPR